MTILSYLCSLAAFCIFILICIGAVADAQGAIAFYIMAPVIFLLLFCGYLLGRKHKILAKRVSQILAIALFIIYVSPFTPGLHFISSGTFQVVSKIFELVMGKTPYQWFQQTDS